MNFLKTFLILFVFVAPLSIQAQKTNKAGSQYQFTTLIDLSTTDVKNQFKSNTCWSYASNSFLESELLRMGKPKTDLSELFIVHNIYLEKAEKFVRMLGKTQFAAGGQSHDVMHAFKTYGVVPQSVYAGKQPLFDHLKFDDSLRAGLDKVVALPNKKLDASWKRDFEQKLDDFMGKTPDRFEWEGKMITPKEHAASLGINPDDYVEIGSFSHHPFYQKFIIECPDNWAWTPIYNVPLSDFQAIADNALSKGFTINWDADVSEKYFNHKNGLAIVPRDTTLQFEKPMEELVITQENRQAGFDDLTTQDDHLMHITGKVKDQTGKEFYTVKNSWGTERNEMGGYLYVSKAYFQYKTIMFMVHKKAIPKAIAKKMGIK